MTSLFWDRGYEIVEGLVENSHIEMSSKAMSSVSQKGDMRQRADGHVYEAEDEYGPVFGEMLLRHCRPKIEAVVDRKLIESYAYWRIYRHGAKLLKHTDRAGSEIAVSITIEAEPAEAVWPIMLKDITGQKQSIVLQPGSGIVYLGHKIPHWREKLEAQSQKQLMLFYILKEGSFRDHDFDGRDGDPLIKRPA